MPSRLANSWSDRARPVASSSNQARPRTIALVNAGSQLDLWFSCASPGSTSLVSTPRCLKATATFSSIEVSLAVSDADNETPLPHRGPQPGVEQYPPLGMFDKKDRDRQGDVALATLHQTGELTGYRAAGECKELDRHRRLRSAVLADIP